MKNNSGFDRTSGFENNKVSGFANNTCPVLLAPRHNFWTKSSGEFRLGADLVFNVTVDYKDQASNPFLHTFHPDHDNLKGSFSGVEVQGAESYTFTRVMKFSFTAPAADFASLTAGTGNFGGVYTEVMTIYGRGNHAREFTLSGVFSMNRMSEIFTLTKQ